MNQNNFEILEIFFLIIGCLINLITFVFLWNYTNKTYRISQLTAEIASEAAKMTKITEESIDLSAKVLVEMRETRDVGVSPFIFVYFDQMKDASATKIFLVVQNAGAGMARDIRIKFNPELQSDESYSLSHIHKLFDNIPTLPPGKEIRHAFAFTPAYFNASPSLPKEYQVHISYKGGLTQTERILNQIISLDFFEGL